MRDDMYAEAWYSLRKILSERVENEFFHSLERYECERIIQIMDNLIHSKRMYSNVQS